jgi:peptidoglycan-N-acetylmuramic acid deacetylase
MAGVVNMKRLLVLLLILICGFLIFPGGRNAAGLEPYGVALDNSNHGWEVKRSTTHNQPDVPVEAGRVIKKYDGIYVGNPEQKVIYLTIDLGYESGNTDRMLDVLSKNGVKATFFVIASYIEKNPRIVERILNEGHSLQNHTANYRHLYSLSDYQIKKEITYVHDLAESRYNISMKYLRLPYEEWSERVMSIAHSLGYKTVFWSIACVDWVEGRDARYIYNSVINNHHNGAVILLHAVSESSPKALDMIICDLSRLGYKFKVLDM